MVLQRAVGWCEAEDHHMLNSFPSGLFEKISRAVRESARYSAMSYLGFTENQLRWYHGDNSSSAIILQRTFCFNSSV